MLKQKEIDALYFLRRYPEQKVAVSFSGGKDSLVALHLAYRAGIRKAVFSDTRVESKKTIDFVKDVGTILGIDIEILRPRKSFWELALHLGTPSINNRWCCPTIKFQQLNEYARNNGIHYYVTGLRRSESLIRRDYKKVDKNPMLPNVTQLNPILDWSEEDVWNYIREYDLPFPPAYREGLPRNGCVICPYKSPRELKKLRELEPDIWNKFEEILKSYAQKLEVPNMEEFLNGGWRAWRPPAKRKIVGKLGPDNKLELTSETGRKEFRLLGILNGDKTSKRKYKILIEKELNCIGCGACLSLCPVGALKINDEGVIDVEVEKCNHCYSCLDTTKLRGGCVGRNYRLEVFLLQC
jgi:phosphoadenosine phosphosulfate reductase